MSGRLPEYEGGEYASAAEVNDAKAEPPHYHESESEGPISGETYSEKAIFDSVAASLKADLPSDFTVHATETENFVLIDRDTSQPVFYVDNTTALSKTHIRAGNSTRGKIISVLKVAGPFVKEMLIEYTSIQKSRVREMILVSHGKFSPTWQFEFRTVQYVWKAHKGVWTLTTLHPHTDGHAVLAVYDTGRTFKIKPSYLLMTDIIIATVFSISLYGRLATERRQRALNSVTGKNSGPLLATGLLL